MTPAGEEPGAGAPADPAEPPETALHPGRLVARRYRIHRLLGRGSMGEVYSADDTTLGRAVALKFLPADRQGTSWRLRFAQEVEIAQRVSHPNVCRVFEIGGFEQRVYMSMELIEGESLAQVLARSLGQLTAEEKLRIAHDLCDGLAAIHGQGVVHCDLKPSNVMLEHSGRAIITDFGVATAGGLARQGLAGTPEYMAPEQAAGGPSFRTDLYSLGLVLYELFAGRRWQRAGPMELPACSEVESKVREAVSGCLQVSPEDRPDSARRVADRLPPRPPLNPRREDWLVPPETLLVSPRSPARPAVARALFAAVVVVAAAVAALAPHTQVASLVEISEPPVVLAALARQHLASLGYGDRPRDRLYGFEHRRAEPGPPGGRPEAHAEPPGASPSPVRFWYLESPRRRVPSEPGRAFRRPDDLPLGVPGALGVHLDPAGRLLALDAEPEAGGGLGPWPEPSWERLFAAAGLDPRRFEETVPTWRPGVFADFRRAWEEREPAGGGPALRVEAAAYHGRPVALRVVSVPAPGQGEAVAAGRWTELAGATARAVAGAWLFAVLAVGVYLAPRNLLHKQADRPAAFRLAVAVFAARLLVGLLGADHQHGLAEGAVLQAHLARSLHMAALVWFLDVALEPYVRRWWPDLMASGVRVLYGRLRDPLVGRDLLLGVLCGAAAILGTQLAGLLPAWAGASPPAGEPLAWELGELGHLPQLEALRGYRQTLAVAVFAFVHGLLVAFVAVIGVALLSRFLRHPRLSRGVILLLATAVILPCAGTSAAGLLAAGAAAAAWLALLVRFGLLATLTATAVAWTLSSVPLTLDPGAWYAPGSATVLLGVLSLAGWGLFASLDRGRILPPGLLNLEGEGAVAGQPLQSTAASAATAASPGT